MKVLITGCSGMLGHDLMQVFGQRYDTIGASTRDFDITDINSTLAFIKNIKPDVIVHSAAYTDVDGCESNIEKAFKVNSIGARNIAIAAQEVGSSIAYISTDYVYDGTKIVPYIEYDSTNPLNIYGRSKLEGENFVRAISDRYYIIRTSWLFGTNGKNFVSTILKAAESRDELQIVDDQNGSPTYTLDLAKGLIGLVQSGYYGTYHLTNSGYCSWFEFAEKIFKIKNNNKTRLIPIKTDALERPAKRPQNSMLEKFYWKLNGFEELRTYEEAVKEYLKIL